MNQFAKISPIVTSSGYIIEIGNDGTYENGIVTQVRLKENEIGICLNDSSLITIHNNEAIKLTGKIFSTYEEAMEYVLKNTTGENNGELVICKSNPRNIYTILGTKLYNLVSSTSHSSLVIDNKFMTSNNMNIIINNDIIQEGENYLLERILLKISNNELRWRTSDNSYIDNVALKIFDDENNFDIIYITKDMRNKDNIIYLDFKKQWSGKLYITICEWDINNNSINENINFVECFPKCSMKIEYSKIDREEQ